MHLDVRVAAGGPLLLVGFAAAVACSSAPVATGGSVDVSQPAGARVGIARQIVALNAAGPAETHLLARKYLASDTEVVEFYEMSPGRVSISVAGAPEPGAGLAPASLRGKSAAEVWALAAPDEAIPEALAAAIARANDPASHARTDVPRAAASSADARIAALAAARAIAAPQPARGPTEFFTITGNGYCGGQFWTDLSDWVNNAEADGSADNWNDGMHETSSTGVNQVGYVMCPENLGGQMIIDGGSDGKNWYVPAQTFRSHFEGVTWNCGWDFNCWWTTGDANSCSMNLFNTQGMFIDDCWNEGIECDGDVYDYVVFYSHADVTNWCVDPPGNLNLPHRTP
jgi:hypothetical protein